MQCVRLFRGGIFLALFLGLFSLQTNSASAFGVSPPFINAIKLIPGSRFESVIYLVQGKPDYDLKIQASFELPEKVKDWVSLDAGQDFIIPKGTRQFPVKVLINVPQNAELGIYKGVLRVISVPSREEGAQINIATGARIELNIAVGNDLVVDFEIKKLDILDIHEGDGPAVAVTLENKGNVAIAPDYATFEIFDKYGDNRLGFAQVEKFPEIKPFQTETFTIEFPIGISLGIGEYWGEAKIYREKAVLKSLRTVFDVTERKVNTLALAMGGGGGAGIFLLLLAAAFFRRKRKAISTPNSSDV
ncbi:MAG: hypothetical protein HYT12_00310 [Candidatus Liptonbacteria bacterium]|nr:hypothetical protein [Candidatus Liptonbacteria bacterium]